MSLITPSSHCFNCKKPIPLRYNIPIVGYYILRGKCKLCQKPFPSRYVFVELITAILTIIIYLIFGLTPSFFMYVVLTYLLLAVTFVDIDHFIIPNGFILFGIMVLGFGLFYDLLSISWEYSLSGAFVFAGFWAFLAFVVPNMTSKAFENEARTLQKGGPRPPKSSPEASKTPFFKDI